MSIPEQQFVAEAVIKEFLNIPGRDVIKSFGEGEVFSAAQYGEGTIVRIYGEVYTEPGIVLPFMQRPKEEKWQNWGAVTGFNHEGQRRLVIVSFGEDPNYVWPGVFDVHDPVVRIGEVDHVKDKPLLPFLKNYQRLELVDLIEVWSIGRAQRRSLVATEPQRVSSWGLIPEGVHS